jgi:putative endonuclease
MAGLVPAIHEGVVHGSRQPHDHPMDGAWVYILTNRPNGTLYVGVTSDLVRRIFEHREGLLDGFSKKYQLLKRLVYAEPHADITAAIQRERNMKHRPRAWKVRQIRIGTTFTTGSFELHNGSSSHNLSRHAKPRAGIHGNQQSGRGRRVDGRDKPGHDKGRG